MNKLETLFQSLVKQSNSKKNHIEFQSSFFSKKKNQTFNIYWSCDFEHLMMFCFEILSGQSYLDVEISNFEIKPEEKVNIINQAFDQLIENFSKAMDNNHFVYYLASQWMYRKIV